MSFLGKAKKIDLQNLAIELGESVEGDIKVLELKRLIMNSKEFTEDTDFVKNLLDVIISTRVEEEQKQRELREREELERQRSREFELEKLRLQSENQKGVETGLSQDVVPRVDFQKILSRFNVETDDINLFLVLFERQMKILKISENMWVTHLIGVLSSEISKLLAREPGEKFQEYSYIRGILLQRFKMTAEKFRKLFSQKKKTSNITWKDFYFETRSYFEGWISELKISTFEELKDLMISDQMKKRCDPDCKEHYLDEWEGLISPEDLAEKLDTFENLRNSTNSLLKKRKFFYS